MRESILGHVCMLGLVLVLGCFASALPANAQAAVCGNGIIEGDEECDDGNTSNFDGCTFDCEVEKCGDGDIDEGEECDDGNTTSGDGCSATCQNEECGNGTVDDGEECDDGNTTNGDGCSATCEIEKCGDGDIDSGEECDDGNDVSGDGCSEICELEECGDGNVDDGEECDDGNTTSGDGCSATCQLEECGDGNLDDGEECDDGNNDNGDGCNESCEVEKCGNGVLDDGEECDDGNNEDGDGCSADCRIEEEEGEGCTPGFWKNHTDDWEGYTPGQLVGSVFSAASAFPSLADDTLLAALQYKGGDNTIGGARILLRACVAARLNEAHGEVDYTVTGVVGLCNAALASGDRQTMLGQGGLLDDANNGEDGCPLGGDNTSQENRALRTNDAFRRFSHQR